MRWRPLAALSSLSTLASLSTVSSLTVRHETETPHGYPHQSGGFARSAELAEALARIEVATQLRDGEAVARILTGLSHSEDGQWLLRQCVAAGLRDIAGALADPGPSAAGLA
jgi:hypothetical protein